MYIHHLCSSTQVPTFHQSRWRILPWRQRQQIPTKHWYLFMKLHIVNSAKPQSEFLPVLVKIFWTSHAERTGELISPLVRPGRKQVNVSVRMAWISFGALSLQEKKLDDSSRLDFVEITRIPDMLPSLFLSWSGQGLISTPVLYWMHFCYNRFNVFFDR